MMRFACHGCEREFREEWLGPLWLLEPGGPAQRNLCLECMRGHRVAMMDPLECSQWIMELMLLALAAPKPGATVGEKLVHSSVAVAMQDEDVRGAYLELVADTCARLAAGDAGAEAG